MLVCLQITVQSLQESLGANLEKVNNPSSNEGISGGGFSFKLDFNQSFIDLSRVPKRRTAHCSLPLGLYSNFARIHQKQKFQIYKHRNSTARLFLYILSNGANITSDRHSGQLLEVTSSQSAERKTIIFSEIFKLKLTTPSLIQ